MNSPRFNPSIFREYDIRGIAEKDLSADLAERLGLAYAAYLNRSPVAKAAAKEGRRTLTVSVGRDCRLTGERYSNALIQGLRSAGLNVVSLGVCPTPLTYFSLFHLNLDGAIMVTGSHNPSDYNGFKICLGKDTLHGSQIQDLRQLIEDPASTPKAATPGDLTHHAIIPSYIDHVVKHTPRVRPLKVVLDAGNGTAGSVAPELFKRLGAQVTPLFCELDGRFPNHHPDPTVVENLKDLIAAVKKEKADFGIGFDGDSDRIGMVDENGRVVFGDELMVIFSRDVLKKNPGATIISEVKSSHRLYDDIAAKGGKPLMWKTGHSLIKAKMKETGAKLAGEMSGHIFFSDRYFGYDDAIYAAVRMYEIAAGASGPVSTLTSDLTPMIATPEIRVDCEESLKFELVAETKKTLAAKHKTNDIDGVRVEFGDAWGLLRASNTQPVLVLRFEAPTEGRMKEIRATVEGALREAAQKLGHAPLF